MGVFTSTNWGLPEGLPNKNWDSKKEVDHPKNRVLLKRQLWGHRIYNQQVPTIQDMEDGDTPVPPD